MIDSFAQSVYLNRNYRFWFFQVMGWSAFSLATFLSITLVDGNLSWPHIGHIGLSATLGMLATWPLRSIYHATFDIPLWRRILIAIVALIVLCFVWTLLRILVFAWIVGEDPIWGEFNYWFFGSLSIFLSWTALYYGINYYELLTLEHQKLLRESALKSEEKMRRFRAEASARDAQLRMLRYQLTPHFLFNTLNAINALVSLKENEKAQEMLRLLSDFLRRSLEHDGIDTVCFEQELQSLQLYLNIEKVRFEDRLQLEFAIDPAARPALVPYLLLQPVVENSMKYAIAASKEGGVVRIVAEVADGQLHLQVSDTGSDDGSAASDHGRGVGLSNTLNRLRTLYDESFTFVTEEIQPSGLAVRITIPFQTVPLSRVNAGAAL